MFLKDFSRSGPAKARNVTTGLIAGTLVEGAGGWLPVEDLRIGDAVHSYDGGLARVLGLDRLWIVPQAGAYILHLPGGALDNCSDLVLLPDQTVLIDTMGDDSLPDDIVALVPAAALEGTLATRLRIEKPLEVITPRFADDEAVFANSGTLLHCPDIRQSEGQAASDFFASLDLLTARRLLQRLHAGSALQPDVRQAA